jgi:hypothetical protein
VNKKMFGLMVVGSALGAWWWTTQRRSRSAQPRSESAGDRGTVIFDNTPTAADIDAIV